VGAGPGKGARPEFVITQQKPTGNTPPNEKDQKFAGTTEKTITTTRERSSTEKRCMSSGRRLKVKKIGTKFYAMCKSQAPDGTSVTAWRDNIADREAWIEENSGKAPGKK